MMKQHHFNLKRILTAVSGTGSMAAANLMIALLLLNSVSAAQFGVFAFAQIVISLGYAISNATLGSPLTVAINREEVQHRHRQLNESYFRANALLSLAGSAIVFAVVLAFNETASVAALFALAACVQWIRWFGRAHAHASHDHGRVVLSDATYSVVLVSGAAWIFLFGQPTIGLIAAIQSLAALAGLVLLGRPFLSGQMGGLFSGRITPFLSGFRNHGRHALVGVSTTELTSNAHAYVVTLMLGPAAFSPLAAALLLYRPTPLVLQTMTQVERPRLGHLMREENRSEAARSITRFRWIASGVWLINIAVALVVSLFFLDKIVGETHSPQLIAQAAMFWAIITGLACVRAPASALLQANGDFRALSHATIISSLVTLPTVILLTYALGAVWSLMGVVVGEVVAAVLLTRMAKRLLNNPVSLPNGSMVTRDGHECI